MNINKVHVHDIMIYINHKIHTVYRVLLADVFCFYFCFLFLQYDIILYLFFVFCFLFFVFCFVDVFDFLFVLLLK